MKKYLFIFIAFAFILSAPAVTHANQLFDWGTSLSVDCDYFTITYSGITGDGCAGDVAYELILTPQNSANAPIVINGTFDVPGPWQAFFYSTFAGEWGDLPCGEYTVTGTLSLMCNGEVSDMLDLAPVTLVCGCIPAFDPRTPGYWKNHAEMWPVEYLTLGNAEYTKAQLLVMLNTPVKGDAKVIMIKHLIAATLNVLSGADTSIQGSIDAADACLIDKCGKSRMLTIKDALDAFNNSNNE